MVQPDKLDDAMRIVAMKMEPKQPEKLLRRWLRYFPASMYPYVVAEYRRLIGRKSFVVLEDGRQYSAEAHQLMLSFAKLRQRQ